MTARDVTDETFEADVLERSETTPVIVDLWAPWCGPCRTLGPIIEQAVEATGGEVVLAKVNVDENPRVSAIFGVQSIPAVFAISRQQVIDRFVGALPMPAVEAFVEKVREASRPSEAETLLAAGDEASLRKALELEPANERVIEALAGALVDRGDTEGAAEALELLERIPETTTTRHLAALARTGGGAASTEGDAGENLEDHLEALLERVPSDDDARQEIVDLIETMDGEDPRREHYRRALSAKLF